MTEEEEKKLTEFMEDITFVNDKNEDRYLYTYLTTDEINSLTINIISFIKSMRT